jgi:hypothetical protein
MWLKVLGGDFTYQFYVRGAVLGEDTNVQSFQKNVCELDILSKFEL